MQNRLARMAGPRLPERMHGACRNRPSCPEELPQERCRWPVRLSAGARGRLARRRLPRLELERATAGASGERLRQLLGERLFPLVSHLAPEELAGKVTGMLLELETAVVIDSLVIPGRLAAQRRYSSVAATCAKRVMTAPGRLPK